MKNIPLSTLPNFHGLSTADPDDFLFEFGILCRIYDYTTTTHHQLIRVFDPMAEGEMNSEMFSEIADNQSDSAVTTNTTTTDDETTTTDLFPRVSSKSIAVEIEPGKTLNINPDLSIVETR